MGSSGSYFKVDPQNSFDFKKFKEISAREVRAVHEAWGQRMADGYNKIVADWSPETRPHFQAITRYIKATSNVFVYVYIRGTKQQKMIFSMIDHGARRGQWVSAGAGLDRTEEEETVLKSYRAPPPPIVFPSKPPGARPDPLRGSSSALRPWKKYDKEVKFTEEKQRKATAIAKRKKKRRVRGPGRTKKQSRLGPTPYTPRTNKSGGYRGAGYSASANPPKSRNRGATSDSAWRGRGQPKRMKLKPIPARRYSLRLRWLILGRSWPWAEEIWGPMNKMLHKNIVQLGYRNANRATKKAK